MLLSCPADGHAVVPPVVQMQLDTFLGCASFGKITPLAFGISEFCGVQVSWPSTMLPHVRTCLNRRSIKHVYVDKHFAATKGVTAYVFQFECARHEFMSVNMEHRGKGSWITGVSMLLE
jgi:hypothetical protein